MCRNADGENAPDARHGLLGDHQLVAVEPDSRQASHRPYVETKKHILRPQDPTTDSTWMPIVFPIVGVSHRKHSIGDIDEPQTDDQAAMRRHGERARGEQEAAHAEDIGEEIGIGPKSLGNDQSLLQGHLPGS